MVPTPTMANVVRKNSGADAWPHEWDTASNVGTFAEPWLSGCLGCQKRRSNEKGMMSVSACARSFEVWLRRKG